MPLATWQFRRARFSDESHEIIDSVMCSRKWPEAPVRHAAMLRSSKWQIATAKWQFSLASGRMPLAKSEVL